MEEKTLKKFSNSVELCGELESKSKKSVLLFITNIILPFIMLCWFYSEDYHSYDEGKALFAIVIILAVISLFSTYKSAVAFSTISVNLTKNKLEIKSTYLSGIYTENPKSTNNEKYFKIPYNQIEKIEITGTNIKAEKFHNLMIYYSGGIIKLALAEPGDAKIKIYNLLSELENANKMPDL